MAIFASRDGACLHPLAYHELLGRMEASPIPTDILWRYSLTPLSIGRKMGLAFLYTLRIP